MASRSTTPGAGPQFDRRLLWAVRIATLVCLLSLLPHALPDLPLLVGHLFILWRLRTAPDKVGLWVAKGMGALVFVLTATLLVWPRSEPGYYPLSMAQDVLVGLAHAAQIVTAMRAEPPPLTLSPLVERRWLEAVRAAALLSLLLVVPVFMSAGWGFGYAVLIGWALLLAPAAVLALLYAFTLWWFPGRRLQNGLVLATVTGAAGGLFGLICLSFALRVSSLALVVSGVFLLTNVMLVAAAIKGYWTGRRAEGERPSLLGASVASVVAFGPLIIYVLVFLFLVRPQQEWERQMEQAYEDSRGPLGALYQLERINRAARTHAERYHNGYPPSLGAFGPPPGGGGSNCDHAGRFFSDEAVMTSEFSFEYRRYKFDYRPGPGIPRSVRGCTPGVQSYTLSARRLPYSSSSWITHRKVTGESFFTDETGVIHSTEEDRPATAQDPPLP